MNPKAAPVGVVVADVGLEIGGRCPLHSQTLRERNEVVCVLGTLGYELGGEQECVVGIGDLEPRMRWSVQNSDGQRGIHIKALGFSQLGGSPSSAAKADASSSTVWSCVMVSTSSGSSSCGDQVTFRDVDVQVA